MAKSRVDDFVSVLSSAMPSIKTYSKFPAIYSRSPSTKARHYSELVHPIDNLFGFVSRVNRIWAEQKNVSIADLGDGKKHSFYRTVLFLLQSCIIYMENQGMPIPNGIDKSIANPDKLMYSQNGAKLIDPIILANIMKMTALKVPREEVKNELPGAGVRAGAGLGAGAGPYAAPYAAAGAAPVTAGGIAATAYATLSGATVAAQTAVAGAGVAAGAGARFVAGDRKAGDSLPPNQIVKSNVVSVVRDSKFENVLTSEIEKLKRLDNAFDSNQHILKIPSALKARQCIAKQITLMEIMLHKHLTQRGCLGDTSQLENEFKKDLGFYEQFIELAHNAERKSAGPGPGAGGPNYEYGLGNLINSTEERNRLLEQKLHFRKAAERKPMFTDNKADAFWRDYLGDQLFVSGNAFLYAFKNYMLDHFQISDYKKIESLIKNAITYSDIRKEMSTTVDIQKFREILHRFGPFENLLKNISTTCDFESGEHLPWFKVWDRATVENFSTMPGMHPFLVRYSETNPQEFALTYQVDGRTINRRITRLPTGEYQLIMPQEGATPRERELIQAGQKEFQKRESVFHVIQDDVLTKILEKPNLSDAHILAWTEYLENLKPLSKNEFASRPIQPQALFQPKVEIKAGSNEIASRSLHKDLQETSIKLNTLPSILRTKKTFGNCYNEVQFSTILVSYENTIKAFIGSHVSDGDQISLQSNNARITTLIREISTSREINKAKVDELAALLEQHTVYLSFIAKQTEDPIIAEIPDQEAKNFWNANFPGRSSAPLKSIVSALQQHLTTTTNAGLNSLQGLETILRKLIDPNGLEDKSVDVVMHATHFKLAVRRLGPFRSFISHATALCSYPDGNPVEWFKPELSRLQAEEYLRIHPDVPLVVRYSSGPTEDFVVSLREGGGFTHRLLRNEPNGYQLVLLDTELAVNNALAREKKPPKYNYGYKAHIVDVLNNDVLPLTTFRNQYPKQNIEGWDTELKDFLKNLGASYGVRTDGNRPLNRGRNP